MIKSQGVDKLLKIAHERKSPDEIKKKELIIIKRSLNSVIFQANCALRMYQISMFECFIFSKLSI